MKRPEIRKRKKIVFSSLIENPTEEDFNAFNGRIIGFRKGKTLNDIYQESIKATNRRKFGWTNKRG